MDSLVGGALFIRSLTLSLAQTSANFSLMQKRQLSDLALCVCASELMHAILGYARFLFEFPPISYLSRAFFLFLFYVATIYWPHTTLSLEPGAHNFLA